MTIKLGPAGMGPLKDVENAFKEFKRLGIKASEIPFTHGIYIKKKEVALKIKRASEKFGISLSIHAPYWINLNSENPEVIENSKKRLLKCAEVGTWIGVKKIIFHPGYFGQKNKKESYENIKERILEILKEIREKKYAPILCAETTGRLNVFGSIDEIESLVRDTGCSFCIDFAHLLARYKNYKFDKIKKQFGKFKEWHIHFSGIEYGEKGEKHHLRTSDKEWKKLFKNLPKNKNITIINESPNPLANTILGLEVLKSI